MPADPGEQELTLRHLRSSAAPALSDAGPTWTVASGYIAAIFRRLTAYAVAHIAESADAIDATEHLFDASGGFARMFTSVVLRVMQRSVVALGPSEPLPMPDRGQWSATK